MTKSPSVLKTEDETSSQKPWLEVSGIAKSYGGIAALRGVSLQFEKGRVHGLIGANGAGKSTLIKCLAGAETPDSGTFFLEGKKIEISDPSDSMKLGFAFIHQEVSLIPSFDVFRNMALGLDPVTRFGFIDWRILRSKAQAIHERLAMTFSLDARVDDLSVAQKWLVLIGRALMQDAALIAMDEPTASLSLQEINDVHKIIKELVKSGVAVLFVSHRLDEVIELCDVISIFRDGSIVNEFRKGGISKQQLVTQIVGREIAFEKNKASNISANVVLKVSNLSDEKILRDVNFSLHQGEILGFSGLVGAGRTEIAKIIYGAGKRTSGKIELFGNEVNFKSPAQGIKAHIGFVPEERRAEGIFGTESITFNITISSLSTSIASKILPLLKVRQMRKNSEDLSKTVTVNTENMKQKILTLSGGNQQKVVIARWLGNGTKLLILDEPSRGVDVGARGEIHKVIRELAKQGTSIIVISSDDEELEALCDRVLTLVEGQITAEVSGADLTAEHLTSLSFGKKTA
jgi:ABC-type sugar transport system ATPase subunit